MDLTTRRGDFARPAPHVVGIAKKIAHDRDANARSYPAHRRRKRAAATRRYIVERASDLSDDATSSPRRHLPHPVSVDDDQANRVSARVCDRGESDRHIARRSPFPQRPLGIRHRRGRIHDEHRGHGGAVLSKSDVCAIASSKESPIDALRIVALTIDAVLAELGGSAAKARVVRTWESAGHRPQGRPFYAPNRVEKRAAGLRARCLVVHTLVALCFPGRASFAHVAAAKYGCRSPELARDESPRRRSVRR
jgi:hypothetical protein